VGELKYPPATVTTVTTVITAAISGTCIVTVGKTVPSSTVTPTVTRLTSDRVEPPALGGGSTDVDAVAASVDIPGTGAYSVWSFMGPTDRLGDFVTNEQPGWFDSHSTVQVYQTGPDGKPELVDEFDPWSRPW
jgi:hypothetical protein